MSHPTTCPRAFDASGFAKYLMTEGYRVNLRIDTDSVARNLESVKLHRLPALIVDECLTDAPQEVARTADMILKGEISLPYEIFAMPKKRFGPRPITFASTAARVAYTALVNSLGDTLGPKSRQKGKWEEYKSFAISSDRDYVVQFDIASYYEYVDHGILFNQILSQTLNPQVVGELRNALSSVAGSSRGLPQLSAASDHLADFYIGMLERRLIRDGFSVMRFVDDFTVPCGDWETANVIIERAAEHARSLGLILSSEKTSITKRTTLISADEAEARFLNESFEAAKAEIFLSLQWEDYEGVTEPEDVSQDGHTNKVAMWSLLNDWMQATRAAATRPEDFFHTEGHYRRFLPKALELLHRHDERVPDDILQEVVFKHPLFLEYVCKYILARMDSGYFGEDPWPIIRKLTEMGRQSPWAKLWLLDTVAQAGERLPQYDAGSVMDWVRLQMSDRHEVVRAQAAWATASHGQLEERGFMEIYTHASPISQSALAACMAKQGNISKSIVTAVQQDGPLIKKAYKWAMERKSTEF